MLNFNKAHYEVKKIGYQVTDDYVLTIQVPDPAKGSKFYKSYRFSGYETADEAHADARKKLEQLKNEHEMKTKDIISPEEFSAETAKLKAYLKRPKEEENLSYDEFLKLKYP